MKTKAQIFDAVAVQGAPSSKVTLRGETQMVGDQAMTQGASGYVDISSTSPTGGIAENV